jgi:anaerobic ribonucleoside-triphosphate reductase activating protein
MRYASIREMDITNGIGIGVSLFVQGCTHHCKGCFNPETWDFNGGKEWTQDIENKFIELCKRPHIDCVSILGGEPFDQDEKELN